jgi:hypothetical protein
MAMRPCTSVPKLCLRTASTVGITTHKTRVSALGEYRGKGSDRMHQALVISAHSCHVRSCSKPFPLLLIGEYVRTVDGPATAIDILFPGLFQFSTQVSGAGTSGSSGVVLEVPAPPLFAAPNGDSLPAPHASAHHAVFCVSSQIDPSSRTIVSQGLPKQESVEVCPVILQP